MFVYGCFEHETETRAATEALASRTQDDWQEGELYICRQGKLEHIERDPSDMRRVRITEEAYQVAMELGKQLRPALAGYKPGFWEQRNRKRI